MNTKLFFLFLTVHGTGERRSPLATRSHASRPSDHSQARRSCWLLRLGNAAFLTLGLAAQPGLVHAQSAWRLDGNSGTIAGTNFLGTTDDQALEFRVNNTRFLRVEPNVQSPNIIGGYSGNSVVGSVGAIINAGGANGGINQIYQAPWAIVGGGIVNTIQSNAYASIIAGGSHNTIEASAFNSTIAGGDVNTIQTDSPFSALGGGFGNTIQAGASGSTIAGGSGNRIQAGALYSALGGGSQNKVQTGANFSTIGGGSQNTVQTNAFWANIGGGLNNTIQNAAYVSTIAGGSQNTVQANAHWATIGGGEDNIASGTYSVVSGGSGNIASAY